MSAHNSDIEKQFSQAKSAFSSGKLGEAERLLKQIIQQQPTYPGAYFYLGKVAQSTGYVAHAIPLIQEALRLDPGNAEYAKALSKQHKANGDVPAAIAVLEAWVGANAATKDVTRLLDKLRGGSKPLEAGTNFLQQLEDLTRAEDFQAVRQLASKLVGQDDSNLDLRYYLGTAQVHLGEISEGIHQLNAVVQLAPKHDLAWGQLGVAYHKKGMAARALEASHKAYALKPNEPLHAINLASSYLEFGNPVNAEKYASEALSLLGNSYAAMTILGRVATKVGQYEQAHQYLDEAIKQNTTFFPALNARLDLAMAEGELKAAEHDARRMIVSNPDHAAAFDTLVDSLNGQLKFEEALEIAEMGAARSPQHISIFHRRAMCLKNLNRFSEAITQYEGVLEGVPDFFPTMVNYASALSSVGRHEESLKVSGEVLKSPQMKATLASNHVFSHLYHPGLAPEDIKKVTAEWVELFASGATRFENWNVSSDGTLRVGFVSGDFRAHPVGFFLESVFAELATLGVEIYLYSSVLFEDDVTQRFKKLATKWIKCYKDNEQTLAQKIHEDGVNILIDVSGHTAHNRLPTFAYKPAPVQITWLGYLSTTGVEEIDYVIGDPWVTPPGEEHHFVEQPLVLPKTYQCLSVPTDTIDVVELPALTNGHITFGSFNNYSKLNDPVLELWAEILKAVPNSKLILKNQVLTDTGIQEITRDKFVALGVEGDRILLEASISREHMLESYGRVDVGLDPFPYTGCTTSFESLWMGVPIITMKGNKFLSHAGESIMNNAGLQNWIAEDGERYVRLAIEKAGNLDELAQLRRGMRARMMASPLMDAKSFAIDLHSALESVWAKHSNDSVSNPQELQAS